jgi:hypothetical protein
MRTKKVGIVTTIAAFGMAALTLATLGVAKGMSASAAEVEPEPIPAAQGWYVVGNGAGTLKDCSWTNYVPDFRLEGEGYVGTFQTEDLTLYSGDAFKVLYADGTWAWPNDSGWKAEYVADYSNLLDMNGDFVDGGLGNIQLVQGRDGVYNFTLSVFELEGEISIYMQSNLVEYVKPPVTTEAMYVVGTLKNYETCTWPGAIDVATNCPAMTYNAATKKWSVELNLVAGDQFKIYNLVNNSYYPSGMNNNYIVAETGKYVVEWESQAPDFTVTPVIAEKA